MRTVLDKFVVSVASVRWSVAVSAVSPFSTVAVGRTVIKLKLKMHNVRRIFNHRAGRFSLPHITNRSD